MANTEDRELEDILVKKEPPKRVEAKENIVKKVAKLTSRTISSLRTKINENRLDKAYAKYNKKYQSMKKAAVEASNARNLKENGEDITNSELAVDYSIVASYEKKLAKMGAKLLKDEIKATAASIDVSEKVSIGKRIKVPRFLLTKMRKLVETRERIRTKKEQKKIEKEITKQTKEYIKSSLDGALFKEDGSLQERINPEVIKNLGLKGGKNDTERRLDTLRGFISFDGKSSLFEKEKETSDELEKDNKANTDLPPAQPTSTVAKEEPKVNVDDLLKGFGKENTVANELGDKELSKPVEKVEDVTTLESNVEDKKEIDTKNDNRSKEIAAIVAWDERTRKLKNALRTTKDPEVRAKLTKLIEQETAEMNNIIKGGDSTQKEETNLEKKEDTLEHTKESKTKSTVLDNKSADTKSIDPIVITEKEDNRAKAEDKKTDDVMTNVEVKNPEQIRVSQVSKPSALRVTLQDIKKLEERNRNAQVQIAQLRHEKEELEKEKAMLKEYIAQASMARDAELQAKNMAESNAVLKGEVAELNSQAAEIQLDLGRTK